MTDLIAQTAADLADLLADSTGTAIDLLAIETATDLLADLKAAAPVITYGKIGPKVVTNPITEDDRGAYCVEEADIESAQPVYVDGELVGELVRLYSQERGTGCDEPTVLGGYVFMETDAAYYNVTEDARVVYAGNARQVLADIKAAIAAVAAW